MVWSIYIRAVYRIFAEGGRTWSMSKRGGGEAVRSCRAAAGGGCIWKFKGGRITQGGQMPPPAPPKYTPVHTLLMEHTGNSDWDGREPHTGNSDWDGREPHTGNSDWDGREPHTGNSDWDGREPHTGNSDWDGREPFNTHYNTVHPSRSTLIIISHPGMKKGCSYQSSQISEQEGEHK